MSVRELMVRPLIGIGEHNEALLERADRVVLHISDRGLRSHLLECSSEGGNRELTLTVSPCAGSSFSEMLETELQRLLGLDIGTYEIRRTWQAYSLDEKPPFESRFMTHVDIVLPTQKDFGRFNTPVPRYVWSNYTFQEQGN
ncbi:MAG: hypothetical protein WC757_01915 [Candidatus Paceibacterota bacterium]|jgi:hypothetical protein